MSVGNEACRVWEKALKSLPTQASINVAFQLYFRNEIIKRCAFQATFIRVSLHNMKTYYDLCTKILVTAFCAYWLLSLEVSSFKNVNNPSAVWSCCCRWCNFSYFHRLKLWSKTFHPQFKQCHERLQCFHLISWCWLIRNLIKKPSRYSITPTIQL